jgi:L,D-peptidoglycan transpeptidase YkuD (ErfK/YbiS/YcfS/YnhG family)
MRKKVWIIATLLWVCLIFRVALAMASPRENDLYEVEGLVHVRDVDQIPAVLNTLSINSAQAVIVEEKYRGSSAATLSTWERRAAAWVRLQKNIDATLGRNGLAPPGEKREGDRRTPSGIYALGDAFGYQNVIDTKIHYRQVSDDDYWVDDPNSVQYNTWVQGLPQAASFEHMKRQDHLYKIGIVIEYNTNPVVPGQGSAIFLHIWREPGASTTGCVAISEEQMVQLLQWLDPLKQPVIILGKDAMVDL